MKITDLLYDAAEDSKKPVNKEYIIKRLKVIGTEYLRIMALSSGEEMTKQYHRNLDSLIASEVVENEQFKNDIQCGKGCSDCCHSDVTITDIEAKVLHSFCKMNDLEFNTELMIKQAGKSTEDWFDLDWKNRKCMSCVQRFLLSTIF